MSQGPDEHTPNVARIYDFFLGGAHNFAADRERAREIEAAYPDVVSAARANRSFLRHSVEVALDLGIRQFLDLGSGVPTVGNVHEIAHRRRADARVAYVDNEPVAVEHSRSILDGEPNATITNADLRDPESVLASPGVAGLLDFTEPVALLAVTAFHFVADEERPGAVLTAYRAALAAGSVLAISHSSVDYPDHPEIVRAHEVMDRLYARTSNPVHPRSRREIVGIMNAAGFVPDATGLVDICAWSVPSRGTPLGAYAVISEPVS